MDNSIDIKRQYGEFFQRVNDELKQLDILNLKENNLNRENTALICIDMVKGFTDKGLLSSLRIKNCLPPIKNILKKCAASDIELVFFADTHSEHSPECKRLGRHCLVGTDETEVADELREFDYKLIQKNSTNGYLEPEFQQWLNNRKDITNFIVLGCCTDICIYNFAVTLQADFDRQEKAVKIYLPVQGVATYDAPFHNGDIFSLVFLKAMSNYGIKLVADVI